MPKYQYTGILNKKCLYCLPKYQYDICILGQVWYLIVSIPDLPSFLLTVCLSTSIPVTRTEKCLNHLLQYQYTGIQNKKCLHCLLKNQYTGILNKKCLHCLPKYQYAICILGQVWYLIVSIPDLPSFLLTVCLSTSIPVSRTKSVFTVC